MSESTSLQLTAAPVATKPTHFTIGAEIDGFPVTIEIEGKAEALRQLIDKLKAIGATAPQKGVSAPTASAKLAGVPVCPVHNAPMKASRKPGSYFCPRQTDDGYCPEKS